MADENDFDALDTLIDCMEQTPPLTPYMIAELSKGRHEIIARMVETGETWNQASGGPTFLSLEEPAFHSHMKAIENDLGEQVAIASQFFSTYLRNGEIPPPHYPWRMAVILRREKKSETERRFLAAWCLHFPNKIGGRYSALVERHEKLVRSSATQTRSGSPPA